ncbi:YkgJ family cysteine cluster protein [Leadbettera azotonutricia]|nr:YkgJ family cysteine cluster protein [Leadbettera azotonutricia]
MQNSKKTGDSAPFYAKGLKFSCTKCSDCCRHEPGFVFLTENDFNVLSKALLMGYTQFMETCCRWVPSPDGTERLSLRERSNLDCVLWREGCLVYEARPLQCRSFPFWPSVLRSKTAWKATAMGCPGMGHGELHSADIIEGWLEQQHKENVIIRKTSDPKGGC